MKAGLEIFPLAPLPPGGSALIRFGKVVVVDVYHIPVIEEPMASRDVVTFRVEEFLSSHYRG